MNKSIESIWQEGFLNEDALIAPQVNDLYNQKSRHLIDRFDRKFRNNLIGIGIGAGILFALGLAFGVPLYGAGILVTGLVIIYFGYRGLQKLPPIDPRSSSYTYLLSFDAWLKQLMGIYKHLYRFLYPLIMALFFLGWWQSDYGQELATKLVNDPNVQLVGGVPILVVGPLVLVILLFGIFAGHIYEWDMRAIYGKEMRKLKELREDMEELRG